MKIEQPTIFSLFDIEDPAEKKVELNEITTVKSPSTEVNKNKKSSTAPAASTAKTDAFEVKVDTIIRYAGMDIPVTNYFDIDVIENGILKTSKKDKEDGKFEYRKIEENDLRKKLEEDYPELVANFTTLVYIKKKNVIVPILQAKKKGLINYDCHLGDSSSESPSLPKKKIPFSLLSDFISIAKQWSDRFGTEIHADIYFDVERHEFFMDFPEQVVNPVLVEITESPMTSAIKFLDRQYIKVMEIHSHQRMKAIPSSTDDANERSRILYAIVGKIDNLFPEITVRTFNTFTEEHIPLQPLQIFEYPFHHIPSCYDLSGVEVQRYE